MTSKLEVKATIKLSDKARGRLGRLEKLLRKNAKNSKGLKFDMGEWGQSEGKEPGLHCGTTACAMGLAAISGEFKKEGLTHKFRGHEDWDGDVTSYSVEFLLKGQSIEGIEAGAEVFDIPLELSGWLFGGEASKHHTGAKAELEMADIIKQILKTGELPENFQADNGDW